MKYFEITIKWEELVLQPFFFCMFEPFGPAQTAAVRLKCIQSTLVGPCWTLAIQMHCKQNYHGYHPESPSKTMVAWNMFVILPFRWEFTNPK